MQMRVQKFLRKVANRQTNRQTNNRRRLGLLGGRITTETTLRADEQTDTVGGYDGRTVVAGCRLKTD